MRLFFTLTVLAMASAALSGATLAWDGSYLLFKLLNLQKPITVHGRMVDFPLHWIVLQASQLTSNLTVLRLVFGGVHAAVPIVALTASWWLVRSHSPSLFIWAAFGIGIGTLPGQVNFTSEAIKAVQLFWPLLLAILIRPRNQQLVVVALLAAAVYFAHPNASLLFGFGAAVAGIAALTARHRRREMFAWAIAFIALGALRLSISGIQSGYESEQLSVGRQAQFLKDSVVGWPIVALMFSWAAGILVLASAFASRSANPARQSVIRRCSFACLIIAGISLVPWARDPHAWETAVFYTTGALFCSLPFMLLAAIDGLFRRRSLILDPALLRHRVQLVQTVGLIFFIVMSLQSIVFRDLTHRLEQVLAQTAGPCIPSSALGALDATVLDHWSVSTYSVLLQGRAPEKVVHEAEPCAEGAMAGSRQVSPFPWDWEEERHGWFDLRQLQRDSASNRASAEDAGRLHGLPRTTRWGTRADHDGQ